MVWNLGHDADVICMSCYTACLLSKFEQEILCSECTSHVEIVKQLKYTQIG